MVTRMLAAHRRSLTTDDAVQSQDDVGGDGYEAPVVRRKACSHGDDRVSRIVVDVVIEEYMVPLTSEEDKVRPERCKVRCE